MAHGLQHAVERGDVWTQLFAGFVLESVQRALDEYPTDRSCHTCDYENAGTCRNNDHAEIPPEFMDQGCPSWKDDGAPF